MQNWKLTKVEYLNNLYNHIKERVNNPNKSYNSDGKKIRNYFGLPVCTKEVFMKFAIKNKRFDSLFRVYKSKQGQRKYAPSIDRINNKKGYIIGNLQFLDLGTNSNKERIKRIAIKNLTTKKVYRFITTRHASMFLNQRGRVNLRYSQFTSLSTGEKFKNLSRKV